MKRKQIYNNNLRGLRESRGLTLTEAAALMKISKVHLSNIESGHDRVSATLITTIKAIYKPSLEEWSKYFASFTQLSDLSSKGSLPESEKIEIENITNIRKVSTLQTRKEVDVNFKWIPKKKATKQFLLLQLS